MVNKTISPKLTALTFGILTISFLAAFYALAVWQEPAVAPPEGNVPAPLNVGSTAQSKISGLILNTGGAPNGLIVNSGNVGIGNANPQKILSFASGRFIEPTGSGLALGGDLDFTGEPALFDLLVYNDGWVNIPNGRLFLTDPDQSMIAARQYCFWNPAAGGWTNCISSWPGGGGGSNCSSPGVCLDVYEGQPQDQAKTLSTKYQEEITPNLCASGFVSGIDDDGNLSCSVVVGGDFSVSGNMTAGSMTVGSMTASGNMTVQGTALMGYEIVSWTQPLKFSAVPCSFGKKVLGGGCFTESSNAYLVKSYPYNDGWYCMTNTDPSPNSLTAYAICARVGD